MAEVETSRNGGVLTITLNRPHVLNAFTAELHRQLVGAFKEARDPEVRAVVVTGARGAGARGVGGAGPARVCRGAGGGRGGGGGGGHPPPPPPKNPPPPPRAV